MTTSHAPKPGFGWKIPALISVLAFAGNSIFCRLALADGSIDAESFTAIRLASGAVFLLCLLKLKSPATRVAGSWKGGLALFLYAWLFSLAYVQLGAGVGALILFGSVQLTMFTAGWMLGERVEKRVLAGMLLAFGGLLALLLPGADAPPFGSSLVMVLSGMAWAAYSLIGRGSSDPLADTTGNFLRSLPLLLILAVTLLIGQHWQVSAAGLAYALASGVLASGAGYVIWYAVMRQIRAQQAATLQLSVPVIAAIGGVLLLGEPLSLRLTLASLVVLGGVAWALMPARKRASAADN